VFVDYFGSHQFDLNICFLHTAYQSWDTHQLQAWLQEHNIAIPSAPSHSQLQDIVKNNWATVQQYGSDQYHAAQHSFQNVKDSVFDTWDESTLRQFLLDRGVVDPSGPREQLVQLAKEKYNDYEHAMSFYSSQMSTGIYGSPSHQMTKSISSVVAQATHDASRKLDDTKDYIYSTWDDDRLRSYLEGKGTLKAHQQASREDMLSLMRDYYTKAIDPVWESWSDSYMVRSSVK
jgi:Putative nuclear envelope organisation protein